MKVVLLIDNYDSFTYNIQQLLAELHLVVIVETVAEVIANQYQTLKQADYVCIGPGPGNPVKMPLLQQIIQCCYRDKPILGICLGHQCLALYFGAQVQQAKQIMHGKTSVVHHQEQHLFRQIKQPITVMRYHSWIVRSHDFPSKSLKVIATTAQGEIMAIAHQILPIYGLQFHPESFLTPDGKQICRHFFNLK